VKYGFNNPHSYRGYYDELAFEVIRKETPIANILDDVKSAVDTTYEGWKGGEFKMGKDTPIWLVEGMGRTGTQISTFMLALLLNDESLAEEIK
jgi:hypothetical protein